LNEIIFIKIPEKFATEINGFKIRADIPLPVEKAGSIEKGSLEDLSWEKIIAAMLKILAFHRDLDNLEYYRNFIAAIKPELASQLIDAGVEKAANKDFTTAEEIFLAIEGLEPDNTTNFLNMAMLYEHRAELAVDSSSEENRKYLDLAFEYHKKALGIDPSSDIVHYFAARFFLNRKNYDKAKNHYTAFLDLSDETEENREKRDEALAIIRQIESSDLLDSKFKQAHDMIQLCREDEAIKIISDFLEKSPDVWNAWFLLGWAYRRSSRFEEGYNAFAKVLELGESTADVLNEIALCSIETGRLKEAEKYLHKALGLEPENTKIISNLGIFHYKNGDTDKALSFFLSALEYDSSDAIAKKYVEIINS
jgi:tetratricopeptide (TPR) repeat protein